MRFRRALFSAVLPLLACFPLLGQSVISVHSGVVHFSEGSVFIDDQPLDQKFGTFASVKEGSTLRTERGRAEVLLTPGVLLRLDENSSVRMVSTAITDTRVEFLQGSVIVDSLDAPADNPTAAVYKNCKVRFPKQGVYRFDSEPAPLFQVYSGQAAIAHDGKNSLIDTSHLFFFAAGTETKKFDNGTDDEFYAWAKDRSEAIASENQLAADTAKDPADLDSGQTVPVYPNLGTAPNYGGPTYAPFGGIYSMGGIYPMSGPFFDPYLPSGMGSWGIYPILYPVYLPRSYFRDRTHTRATSSSAYHRTSTATRISHYQPARPTVYVPPAPRGIGTVRSGVTRPVSVGVPRGGVSIGAHGMGRR